MLAVAAVLAAAIAARASLLASSAGGAWQSAVRAELKSSAGMVEDVRFVYDDEAPQAFRVATARVRAEELRSEAAKRHGAVREALLAEAQAQDLVVETILSSSDIASDPTYATADGGFDLGRRLANQRAKSPDLVALDPDMPQAAGDHDGRAAVLVLVATFPVGLGFLFGALGQAFPRRRETLVALGWTSLGVAALVWAAAEVLG